jgi:hypothetical protein
MAEPNTTVAGLAAAGLTFFGVATGLDPALLIAGFAGGVWGQSYQPSTALWRRVILVILSSIIAGYMSPAISAMAMGVGNLGGAMSAPMLQLPVALLVGLVAHKALGPAVMRVTRAKIEEVAR